MSHWEDFEERICKNCGRHFYVRSFGIPGIEEDLYCSDDCAEEAEFPKGWFNRGEIEEDEKD